MIDAIRIESKASILGQKADPLGVVVSITDPYWSVALQSGWAAVLPLTFHDATRPAQFRELFGGHHKRVLLEFVSRWLAEKESFTLYVHCDYGISRSSAVAVALSEQLQIPMESWDGDGSVLSPNAHVLAVMRGDALGVHAVPRARRKGWRDVLDRLLSIGQTD
ncbi:hypothetical protein LA345_36855 (plasmid) [Burkholderia vietnamiensis]|uniref:Tyrosine specific protein phosphatases domain-containing protein n=1 Tax=Burkholderia vietnamiensis (strain G4 / LMG 22486) TaxID=269482 RepID=A4JV94_BURVG|nr:hypothetical protein Bcep1808_7320 [Burkholderia vietnamiensis G4]MCB4349384.1 hypothetical protein [Burkholderia vietnamiensis]